MDELREKIKKTNIKIDMRKDEEIDKYKKIKNSLDEELEQKAKLDVIDKEENTLMKNIKKFIEKYKK